MKKVSFILLLVLGISSVYFFSKIENQSSDAINPTAGEKEKATAIASLEEANPQNTESQGDTPVAMSKKAIPEAIPDFPVASLPLHYPQGLDEELKQVIASDLSLIYRDVESYDILSVDPPVKLTSGGVEFELKERLEFFGKGRFFPEELKEIYLYDAGAGQQVFVSDQVIEIYRDAKSLKDQNPEVFTKLEVFLDLMNNLQSAKISAPEELLFLYGSAKKYQKELIGSLTPKSFKEAYGQFEYRTPSLLEIKRGKNFRNYLQNLEDDFVAKVYVYGESGNLNDGSPPFVYHDDRWKLLIVIPGT